MIDKTINALACQVEPILLGRQMENNYRRVLFDCSGFSEDIETITLVHQRAQDTDPYIVTSTTASPLEWIITNTDTAYDGYGKAELRLTFANGLAKTVTFQTLTLKSITAETEIPEPLQSWYDAMIDYIDEHSLSPEQIGEAVEEYLEEHPVEVPVQSVNGKTGAVVLTPTDVGALPDTYTAPVASVNGKTGAVQLNAADVGALPDSTRIPTKTSDLQNDSGFLTSVPAEYVTGTELSAALAPKANSADLAAVATSGAYADLSGKPTIPTVPTDVSAFNNDAGYLTNAVTSFNGQSGAVNYTAPNTTYALSMSGNVITLTGSDGSTTTVTLPVYSGGIV